MVHAEVVNAPLQPLAISTAEEILRTIYGDDFRGCTVTLESIAGVVEGALKRQQGQNERELLDLYEKVVEALHLLSTPPNANGVTDPEQLRALLGERLDAIHAVTTKTIDTTARARRKVAGEEV